MQNIANRNTPLINAPKQTLLERAPSWRRTADAAFWLGAPRAFRARVPSATVGGTRCRYEISIFPFGSNGRPHATPAGARARPARPLRERGCPRKEAEAFEGGATQVLRPTPAPPSRSDSSAGSHCASGTRGHGGNAPVPISPAGGPGDHPGHISHWVLPNGGNEIRQLALPYHPPLVGRKLPNGFWKVPSSRRRSSFQSASSRMSV